MAGASSPARPWFSLKAPDPALAESHTVRIWCEDVRDRMLGVFSKSNTYKSLQNMYQELAVFGTAASVIMFDYENVVCHYPLTAGQYCIASNPKGVVDTLYREFDMTAGQMVKRFGYDRCSRAVRSLYDQGTLDTWQTIIHAIEPREDRKIWFQDSANMPWRSVYFEQGSGETAEGDDVLSEGGFEYFPCVVPRWSTTGNDIYGNSPAMQALGDIKQLQHEQLRKANAIDYQSMPPVQVPADLKASDVDMTPGGVTPTSTAGQQAGIRPLLQATLDLSALLQDIEDTRGRINRTFFADLFLMLHQQDKNMTATEVSARMSERMLQLGPVLQATERELLKGIVEQTFVHMGQAGLLPPPPEELEGVDLDIEFISMLSQAQASIGTASADRWMQSVAGISEIDQGVLDMVNGDFMVSEYADMLGVSPKFIRDKESIEALRQARAQAQQAEAQAAMMEQMSAVGKTVAETDSIEEQAQSAAPFSAL
jgi:hypothetical protein